ncbi:hypothetical protein ACJX0J_032505, partial [Zea mays]
MIVWLLLLSMLFSPIHKKCIYFGDYIKPFFTKFPKPRFANLSATSRFFYSVQIICLFVFGNLG